MRRRPRRRPLDAGIPVPKRPYRDTVLVYGVLALLIVGVAYVTDGDVVRAGAFAVGFFVISTAWTWRRFRDRLAQEQRGGR